MARKNMGKIKRYRRSFYSGRQRVARYVGMAVLLVALFAVGWLVGPAVIDFGTSTWYAWKRGEPAESQPQATPVPEATPAPQATPAPTAEPAVTLGEGGWAFVSISAVKDEAAALATAETLAGQGVKYAVLPLKDSQGYIYYASQVPTAQKSIAATTFDAPAAIKALVDAGITPVGSLCAFRDPIAPNVDRSMAVRYQNTEYFWLDANREAGGKPWLNPYADTAVSYITALIDEARALGFEQIWLSGVQFPPSAGREQANFGETGGVSMPDRLAALLAQWQAGGVCWVEYPLEVAAAGAESPLIQATPAQLGVQNLVLRLPAEPTEETNAQLQQVAADAKAGGVATAAGLQGDTFTLIP